ncbi:MAG: bifunctional adenosylcobinamide kinase/adenosylcobinamide-phosphate guanylyltransferase [Bordetella sp.]|uniref:bifunctional adenosylcobinamide kinase/adenosylcobinamide-phosphate guanylyltransferase n=1 Tax=Bordetella sp. TaxID=28081 RepID=UPI003F7B859C
MDFSCTVARAELILGGQKSGKSGRAEAMARAWLAASAERGAVLIATGQAHDDEMAERIARHRRERALNVPGMTTVEEPLWLASCVDRLASPSTLLVIDCLTLWLANWLMPAAPCARTDPAAAFAAQADALIAALGRSTGPTVLVSNEIGLGVIPLGREVRAYVDALGTLNRRLAQVCERVTLMTAGLPLCLKGQA